MAPTLRPRPILPKRANQTLPSAFSQAMEEAPAEPTAEALAEAEIAAAEKAAAAKAAAELDHIRKALENTKFCKDCRQYKDLEEFRKRVDKHFREKERRTCMECRVKRQGERITKAQDLNADLVPEGKKFCRGCQRVFPIEEFISEGETRVTCYKCRSRPGKRGKKLRKGRPVNQVAVVDEERDATGQVVKRRCNLICKSMKDIDLFKDVLTGKNTLKGCQPCRDYHNAHNARYRAKKKAEAALAAGASAGAVAEDDAELDSDGLDAEAEADGDSDSDSDDSDLDAPYEEVPEEQNVVFGQFNHDAMAMPRQSQGQVHEGIGLNDNGTQQAGVDNQPLPNLNAGYPSFTPEVNQQATASFDSSLQFPQLAHEAPAFMPTDSQLAPVASATFPTDPQLMIRSDSGVSVDSEADEYARILKEFIVFPSDDEEEKDEEDFDVSMWMLDDDEI
ncbi:hypothetical protein BJY04DRAFT_215022 [Aspergillus karnatakaensis]|uniref:uncharacterized protein n=1 Tax=Aspergillus karnatakaensis TaxID=1810916 RepID=UPI003CCCF32B